MPRLKISIDADTSLEFDGDFPIADMTHLADRWFDALKDDGALTQSRIAAAVARFHKSTDALEAKVGAVPPPSNP